MHTGFRLEILKGRDHLEHLGVDGRIILKGILGKQGGRKWTVCSIGTGGGLFWKWK
jgi:hypothetical protein